MNKMSNEIENKVLDLLQKYRNPMHFESGFYDVSNRKLSKMIVETILQNLKCDLCEQPKHKGVCKVPELLCDDCKDYHDDITNCKSN